MNKIDVSDVRKILEEVLHGRHFSHLVQMSDEQLLKVNLRFEFDLDSLDFEDMFVALYSLYDIDIDPRYNIPEYKFSNDPTVENFIEMVNDCIKIYGL